MDNEKFKLDEVKGFIKCYMTILSEKITLKMYFAYL